MASDLYELGMKTRREVLGDAYVDNALKNANEMSKPFQDLATEYCWGAIWGREGLARKTRSLVNVAMLVALNKPNELEIHMRAARRNGCSAEEITEVLLQAAVYCGVPAGSEGFRIARKVFAEPV